MTVYVEVGCTAEVGDFSLFDSADQLLAYVGLSPSTYQSGKLTSSHSHIEKRGSRYPCYALFNTTKYVCPREPTFKVYFAKKRAEGKHHYVALFHTCKKLIRLIYRMQLTDEPYCSKKQKALLCICTLPSALFVIHFQSTDCRESHCHFKQSLSVFLIHT